MNLLAEDFARQASEALAQRERERLGQSIQDEAAELSDDLARFVREAWRMVWPNERYVHGRHIDAICEHLRAVSAGELKYLQIWVPPGSSKSSVVSVMWPAWEWTGQPWLRILSASYGQKLAESFAIKSRDVIKSVWYQARWPMVQMRRDHDLKTSYATTAGGERLATSPGGQGTGKHAHRIVIDDAINALEVTSDAALAQVREWHDGTIAMRHIPAGDTSEVIIQQRLAEGDLAGHVLTIDPDAWTVLCLPEEYEPAHPFAWRGDWRTQAGELLWPEVFGETEHQRRALNLGAHRAAGQLQQRPSAREGAILKRDAWKFYPPRWLEDEDRHKLPRFRQLVQSWDTSFKDLGDSDFVCGGLWGQVGADLYLLAMRHDRMGLSATKEAMRGMTATAERLWPRVPMRILVEKTANGVEIIAELKREIRGITPISVSTSKVLRAEAAEPALESGNIWVPGQADPGLPTGYDSAITPAFTQTLIEGCAVFPNGSHDDEVDMFTQAVNWTRARSRQWSISVPSFDDVQPGELADIGHW